MKKFLAMILALALALSATTLSWADGKTTIGDLKEGVSFGYNAGAAKGEAVVIDGGTVEQWADAWVYQDTTIKNVTFKNGAVFNIGVAGVTLKLEDCTFYACNQKTAAEDLGLNYDGTGNDQKGGNNLLTNTGAGMCLDVETRNLENVEIYITRCTSIGDGGDDVSRGGYKYAANGTIEGTNKARGHGIVLNAISGQCEGSPVLTIEGCTIEKVRGNAIQLYGNTGAITIKKTEVKSWGMNSTPKDYAIRGDFPEGGTKTITLEDMTFGMAENMANDSGVGQINVGSYSGNTDGTRAAGTYYVTEQQPTPPRYYYNSTTTDTKADETKGSPKTFDAGMGIYALTAVLSVTGMAYVGKKKF